MREGFGPSIMTPGHMGVDFETRVDFARLRSYRFARAREALEASEFGALLLFDFYNIRYVTGSLQVRYLAPTALGPELLIRGRVQEIRGRKVTIASSVLADGVVTIHGEVVAVRRPDDFGT